jgi:hypothetical protein
MSWLERYAEVDHTGKTFRGRDRNQLDAAAYDDRNRERNMA